MAPPRVTFNDLPPKAEPEDSDVLAIQDATGTKKITVADLRSTIIDYTVSELDAAAYWEGLV